MPQDRLRILCAAGVLTAVSFILMQLKLPFPVYDFYRYDLSDVPALIGAFTLGPWPAVAIILGRNVLDLFVAAEPVGHAMNVLAGAALVLAAGFAYRREHTRVGAIWALVLGVLASTLVMVPLNLLVLPLYLGQPFHATVAIVFAGALPFNLTKGALCALVTYFLYKRVSSRLPHYDLPRGAARG